MDKKERLITNLNINEHELNKDSPILVEFLKQTKQNAPTNNKKDNVNIIHKNH